MTYLLQPHVTRWECPSCGLKDVTQGSALGQSRFHPCPKLAGLTAPMVIEGTAAKHVVNAREDYEGDQVATKDDNGKAVMSIQTVRDDGEDCTVLAPTARVRIGDL